MHMNGFTIRCQMVDVLHHVIKMVFVLVVLWVEDMSVLVMQDFPEMELTVNVSNYMSGL